METDRQYRTDAFRCYMVMFWIYNLPHSSGCVWSLFLNMIQVIDDIIPKKLQKQIETAMTTSMPWHFLPDITNGIDPNTTENRPAFLHMFTQPGQQNSAYYSMIMPIVTNSIERTGYNATQVLACRSFLQLPLSLNNTKPDNAHVDIEREHLVVLYYVMDSDGDTILYDKEWTEGESTLADDDMMDSMTIVETVTPVQGRVVVFDGRIFHTAEQPRKNNRCIINFDVV